MDTVHRTPRASGLTLNICGKGVDKECKDVYTIPDEYQYLFDSQIWMQSQYSRLMFKVLAEMHKNTACIMELQLRILIQMDAFGDVILHAFTDDSFSSHDTMKRLKKFVSECKGPMAAVLLGIEPVGREIGHANMLIFNKRTMKLEHFEPYGSQTPYGKPYTKALAKFLRNLGREMGGFDYVPPNKLCPSSDIVISGKDSIKGPQVMVTLAAQKGMDTRFLGTCQLWSIWYAHLRMMNPDVPSDDVLIRAAEYFSDKRRFEAFIDQFVVGMHESMDKSNFKASEDVGGILCDTDQVIPQIGDQFYRMGRRRRPSAGARSIRSTIDRLMSQATIEILDVLEIEDLGVSMATSLCAQPVGDPEDPLEMLKVDFGAIMGPTEDPSELLEHVLYNNDVILVYPIGLVTTGDGGISCETPMCIVYRLKSSGRVLVVTCDRPEHLDLHQWVVDVLHKEGDVDVVDMAYGGPLLEHIPPDVGSERLAKLKALCCMLIASIAFTHQRAFPTPGVRRMREDVLLQPEDWSHGSIGVEIMAHFEQLTSDEFMNLLTGFLYYILAVHSSKT